MSRKQRKYSYKEYMVAMILYYCFKLGPTKISRILGIPRRTIENWLYYDIVPPSAKWTAKPSNGLAYTIGTVQGDGSVCIRKDKYEYVIELATVDPEFAEVFSKVMARLLNRNYHKPWWDEKRKKWRVRYQSKAFYTWYKRTKKQGLQGFKPYIEHDIETVRYYLMALYDGEGYNYGGKQIQLSNTNKELLEYVQYLLKEYFDIVATGPYLVQKAGTIHIKKNGERVESKHDYYRICIYKREHVKKYLEEIGFSIARKQLGLKRHEKVFVEGIGYVEPYRLVELGLFKLPFSDN